MDMSFLTAGAAAAAAAGAAHSRRAEPKRQPRVLSDDENRAKRCQDIDRAKALDDYKFFEAVVKSTQITRDQFDEWVTCAPPEVVLSKSKRAWSGTVGSWRQRLAVFKATHPAGRPRPAETTEAGSGVSSPPVAAVTEVDPESREVMERRQVLLGLRSFYKLSERHGGGHQRSADAARGKDRASSGGSRATDSGKDRGTKRPRPTTESAAATASARRRTSSAAAAARDPRRSRTSAPAAEAGAASKRQRTSSVRMHEPSNMAPAERDGHAHGQTNSNPAAAAQASAGASAALEWAEF